MLYPIAAGSLNNCGRGSSFALPSQHIQLPSCTFFCLQRTYAKTPRGAKLASTSRAFSCVCVRGQVESGCSYLRTAWPHPLRQTNLCNAVGCLQARAITCLRGVNRAGYEFPCSAPTSDPTPAYVHSGFRCQTAVGTNLNSAMLGN